MTDDIPALAEAPVTRAEFDRLVDVVSELVSAFHDHEHGGIDDGSTYGGSTSLPDNATLKALDSMERRLSALLDQKAESEVDDDD